jgi:hypothetical protein
VRCALRQPSAARLLLAAADAWLRYCTYPLPHTQGSASAAEAQPLAAMLSQRTGSHSGRTSQQEWMRLLVCFFSASPCGLPGHAALAKARREYAQQVSCARADAAAVAASVIVHSYASAELISRPCGGGANLCNSGWLNT